MNRFLFAAIPPILLSQAFAAQGDVANKSLFDQQAVSSEKRTYIQVHEPATEQRLQSSELITPAPEDGEVPLTDHQNTQYYGTFTMGSQKQQFTGVLDTGSSNIWTPETNCYTPGCEGKEKFNPNLSSTFFTEDQELSIQYGTGSMQGYVGYDTVTFGGITVTNQGIGLASQLSDDFQNSPFDGIFGLAYKSIASDQVTPWMDNAVTQGLIPKAVFSFYLSNTPGNGTGRLIIGEPDPDYYQGDITWHPLQPLETGGPVDFYYNIAFDGIAVNNDSIPLSCQSQGNCRAIVDSGTSLIVGPANDITNLQNALNINPDCSNLDEQPDLVFTIDDTRYSVPPEFYVVKQVDWWGQEQCTAGLAPGNQDFWIFGDAFMRGFYVVFDKTDSRIAFATLAEELSAPGELRKLFASHPAPMSSLNQ
ncbi:pepsin-like aspartyl protease [Endozoicomonas sp. SCSIO W0465]|uniref:pepsin-like aspartyl protease n=1 Tax=Endozoicomonas sp. SCSIO W0465 TaxID=2918516 RepID=UPI002074EADC|nr:pepsin-like aspartyl protease [Endozoicomonas sp. SCSIO W0465]USE33946.1 pepsin-like aspartyl protease [Endozoicomonas sp. SCSIO W0465]